MPTASPKNLLLTGPPGCGKTTVICRVIELLDDLRLAVSVGNRDELAEVLAGRLR
jgi:predicted ATPase with chaperone activity